MLGASSIPPLNLSLGPGRMGQCRPALIWSVSPLYGHIFVSRLTLFLVPTLIIVLSLSMSTFPSPVKKGPSFWKLNVSILEDEAYFPDYPELLDSLGPKESFLHQSLFMVG